MPIDPPLHKRRDHCRLCHGQSLEPVLSLRPTPPANAFTEPTARDQPQAVFPLDVFLCRDCSHVQLLDVVAADALFRDYVYVSGTSPAFVQHFEDYAADMVARFNLKAGSRVVEFGSNDATLLRAFKSRGLEVLGIDPAIKIAQGATTAGFPTIPEFFTQRLAEAIRAEMGPADLVAANNVYAHIDDLDDVTRGVRTLLAPAGIFVFEVSYLRDVYQKTLFDTIYHEHLSYHSVLALRPFLERHGLELIAAEPVSSHGGSLRAIAQLRGGPHLTQSSVAERLQEERALALEAPATWRAFGAKIAALGAQLTELLGDLKRQGRTVAGFGAPAKATTLMHQFGLGREVIPYIIDDSPMKQGLLTPGLKIPVVASDVLRAEPLPDYLLILAWNFADAVIAKNADYRRRGGRFIVPVPEVRVVG